VFIREIRGLVLLVLLGLHPSNRKGHFSMASSYSSVVRSKLLPPVTWISVPPD
jgi:hypothetical protein